MQTYRAWAALVLQTDQRAEILFAFHGIGHPASGVLGCNAMFYAKVREGEETTIGEVVPLSAEPFEFTYSEDSSAVQLRFLHWQADAILAGLTEWQRLV